MRDIAHGRYQGALYCQNILPFDATRPSEQHDMPQADFHKPHRYSAPVQILYRPTDLHRTASTAVTVLTGSLRNDVGADVLYGTVSKLDQKCRQKGKNVLYLN